MYSLITQIQSDNVTTPNAEVQRGCNSTRKHSFTSSWRQHVQYAMENTELLKFSSNTPPIGSKLIHVVFNNAATTKRVVL